MNRLDYFTTTCDQLSQLGRSSSKYQVVSNEDQTKQLVVLRKQSGCFWILSWISNFYKPEHQRIKALAIFTVQFFEGTLKRNHEGVRNQLETLNHLHAFFSGYSQLKGEADAILNIAHKAFERGLDSIRQENEQVKDSNEKMMEAIKKDSASHFAYESYDGIHYEITGDWPESVRETQKAYFQEVCQKGHDTFIQCYDGMVPVHSAFLKSFDFFKPFFETSSFMSSSPSVPSCPARAVQLWVNHACGINLKFEDIGISNTIWLLWLTEFLEGEEALEIEDEDKEGSILMGMKPGELLAEIKKHKEAFVPPLLITAYERYLLYQCGEYRIGEKTSDLLCLLKVDEEVIEEAEEKENDEEIAYRAERMADNQASRVLGKHLVDMLRSLADKGDVSSLATLGNCFWYGVGVQKDLQAAFECYERAARLPKLLSRIYETNFIEKPQELNDLMNRVRVDKFSAEPKRYVKSKEKFGEDRLLGRKIFELLQLQSSWYEEALKIENQEFKKFVAKALITLGNCYWFGVAVKADRKKALGLYEQAVTLDREKEEQCISQFLEAKMIEATLFVYKLVLRALEKEQNLLTLRWYLSIKYGCPDGLILLAWGLIIGLNGSCDPQKGLQLLMHELSFLLEDTTGFTHPEYNDTFRDNLMKIAREGSVEAALLLGHWCQTKALEIPEEQGRELLQRVLNSSKQNLKDHARTILAKYPAV
ncbi:MAG: sel1 repeat family protein [Parachlamydiaceae bacterium]|nr:sel1 repeat family protein [Parachlamydiaceae bacterium]